MRDPLQFISFKSNKSRNSLRWLKKEIKRGRFNLYLLIGFALEAWIDTVHVDGFSSEDGRSVGLLRDGTDPADGRVRVE